MNQKKAKKAQTHVGDFKNTFAFECKKMGLPSMYVHNSLFLKHIKNREVSVICDRVQVREWEPFSNAIMHDTSVCSILLSCEHLTQGGRGRVPAIQEVGVSLRVCRGLAGCLKHSSVLAVLQLSNIFLTPENLKLLSNSLPQNSSLKSFGFVGCKIGDDGISALYPGLQVNNSIFTLTFVDCNLTDKSATRIAKLIQHHTIQRQTLHWISSLRTAPPEVDDGVNTSYNYDGDDIDQATAYVAPADSDASIRQTLSKPAAAAAAEGEVTRTSSKAAVVVGGVGLTQINLANNMIGDKGACALADALKQDMCIQEMNIAANNIGHVGALALKEALKENTELITLYLLDNKIDASILGEIKSEVAINVDQKLYLKNNSSNNSSKSQKQQYNNTNVTRTKTRINNCTPTGLQHISNISMMPAGHASATSSNKHILPNSSPRVHPHHPQSPYHHTASPHSSGLMISDLQSPLSSSSSPILPQHILSPQPSITYPTTYSSYHSSLQQQHPHANNINNKAPCHQNPSFKKQLLGTLDSIDLSEQSFECGDSQWIFLDDLTQSNMDLIQNNAPPTIIEGHGYNPAHYKEYKAGSSEELVLDMLEEELMILAKYYTSWKSIIHIPQHDKCQIHLCNYCNCMPTKY